MATTRVFRAGNSQAVRIPHALAFDAGVAAVDVERRGDTLIIRPVKPSMEELIAAIRAAKTSELPRRERLPIDWPKRGRDADAE